MKCTTHHYACDCREAEFDKLKAELEEERKVFLSEHDENVRLHTELERERKANVKLKEALKGLVEASPCICISDGKTTYTCLRCKALLGDSEGNV